MRRHRKNGLYKRAGGIFCFRYKDQQGHWREKSTGETDRTDALSFKKDWDGRNDDDMLPTNKANWTVKQACTRWVEQHTARLTSMKARSNERSYLRQMTNRIGAIKLKNITLDTLKDYQAKRGEQVSARPINLELGILVNVLRETNLWRGALKEYKRLTEPDSEVGEAIANEQLQRLEATAASNPAWEVAYCAELLASNTGMRGAEIKKLRLGAIDLETRRLRIMRKTTKTGKGARWVELNHAATAAACRLYQRAQLLGANDPEHYLLPADLSRHTKATDPLKGSRGFDPTRHQMSWDTAWRKLRAAAGLGKLRFHSLRHTYITVMAELGVPLPVTQSAVGHMSDAITRHYTHIRENVARAAVDKLDQLRNAPHFVDVFVDAQEEPTAKLLN
jgi:integrase